MDSTKILLKLINSVEFQDVKLIYKNLLFLYTNNNQNKINKAIPFIIVIKTI